MEPSLAFSWRMTLAARGMSREMTKGFSPAATRSGSCAKISSSHADTALDFYCALPEFVVTSIRGKFHSWLPDVLPLRCRHPHRGCAGRSDIGEPSAHVDNA